MAIAAVRRQPLSRGLKNTRSVASVEEAASLAIKHDYQFCVHAIGDRANREVLDIFERQFKANPSDDSRRWRIEHAQHLHPDDIQRFGKLGVIASMQAVHCTSDAVFVPTRLGARRSKEGAYVWKSLLDSGAIVTNGTDAPVEDVDPIPCFFASVTRQLKPGVTFFPEHVSPGRSRILHYQQRQSCIRRRHQGFDRSRKTGRFCCVVERLADLFRRRNPEDKSSSNGHRWRNGLQSCFRIKNRDDAIAPCPVFSRSKKFRT